MTTVFVIDSRCVMQADAVLHFGTHGSLEFMPGKQVGMSDLCYPDSLISSIPNIYYYAANNPSEATIAKRRSYANTISYLTPPAENAGLYKGLKVSFCSCDFASAPGRWCQMLEHCGICAAERRSTSCTKTLLMAACVWMCCMSWPVQQLPQICL